MKSGVAVDAGMRTESSSYHPQRLLLILLLCSSLLPIQGSSHGGGEETKRSEAEEQQRQEPLPIERAIGLTVAGSASRWEAAKTWAKVALMNLRTPGSMKDYGGSDSSVGAVVKEAASKSFKKSKEAVEHAPETAVEMAEKAVDKTKEMVMKRTASTPGGKPDAEL